MPSERVHRGRLLIRAQTLIFSGLVASLIIWLASSPNPEALRRQKLNQLIAEGKIGHANEVLQARLEMQFTWLARHAGVKSRIAINQLIRPQQLTLLVTRPEYSGITRCGSG